MNITGASGDKDPTVLNSAANFVKKQTENLKKLAGDALKAAKSIRAKITPNLSKAPVEDSIKKGIARHVSTKELPSSRKEEKVAGIESPKQTFTSQERTTLLAKAEKAEAALRKNLAEEFRNLGVDKPLDPYFESDTRALSNLVTQLRPKVNDHNSLRDFNETCNHLKARLIPHLADPKVAQKYASIQQRHAEGLEKHLELTRGSIKLPEIVKQRQKQIALLKESAELWRNYSRVSLEKH